MDASVIKFIDAWLADPAIAAADKDEIRALQAAGDDKQLADRFYRDLEFGTGGLRGIMGAGRNRMNIYTVGAAAQGLANYVAKQGEAAKKAGVAIAHDCRHNSDAFARRVASVMAGNGIAAHLFDALRPTPELSYAVRKIGCTAGVVITASHNPPEYNGFKAYWSDGGQVTPPHDELITAEVRRVTTFAQIQSANFEEASRSGLIRPIGAEMDEAFLTELENASLDRSTCRTHGEKLAIVYTALHGTGGTLAPTAMERLGFSNVTQVPQQAIYDGAFPTVRSPNPEEGEALRMGIELARRKNAELVIGTDPDADRVGIAVRDAQGDYILLNGNQTAALLTYYICEQRTRQKNFPSHAVVLSTIVSGDLMKEIARSYGAEVIETLTGFKWIAEQIRLFENSPGPDRREFLFGAEESYGCLPAAFVRDKDAVTATALIAETALFAKLQGKTLLDLLDECYRRFGYFQEGVKNITMPGQDGSNRIRSLMQSFREHPPTALGGLKIEQIGDIQTGEERNLANGRSVNSFHLPPSDVIILTLSDGTKTIIRPSGTEPKIKFYVLTRESAGDLSVARKKADAKISAIIDGITKIADQHNN